jgi:hypothetical protein
VTQCIVSIHDILEESTCICQVPAKRRGKYNKVILPITECNNFLAVSPDDYVILYDEIDEYFQELEECRR